MTKILHLDASGRGGLGGIEPHGMYGSFSRRLSQHFMTEWLQQQPNSEVKYRDLGVNPPNPVNQAWIEAAFSREQTEQQKQDLAESDELVDELLWADLVVVGTPMYNFGLPANLKAWIDNIVRVRRTLVIDPNPADPKHPYIPVFKGKKLPVVVLSARGDHGMDVGGEFAYMNHLDPAIKTALGFIGIEEIYNIAIEHTAEGGEALENSVQSALARSSALVTQLNQ
ncbi:NAD(P)H-dependent oxidoreductase [Acinetobacter baumannii]|uniref:FMN-dependent NADH-azoreductase n=1 Tax=Acinetobacter baumannii TaxID=470 RepID=UPI002447DE29|nr:NAD(P)H-dependent oxidoreductase [Acinetobacter baumannii]MDH2549378.1 NAD(P)H-dependent oxidoreductase [Acinetobacter baumannii]MDO7475223.1 NAD(P)H-dependent oxidoreductase [Acinetobacter baumannii]MDO7519893.1 NAD(P)H-dependent oxidoreductase [Acinetobacter baumannii]MDO7523381.1 NAD(P)H-dependent oxidoreductase [Acinetobacter baumannii]